MSPDLKYWYWLRGVRTVGPARIKSLVEHFGSPEGVYLAGQKDYLHAPGVGKGLAKALAESKDALPRMEEFLDKELAIADRLRAAILTLVDPRYPSLLKKVAAVAPPILYVRGTLDPLSEHTIAVVGTRRPSKEGSRWAKELAQSAVGDSWQVISGLAAGIDAVAHQAALDAGGYTVAVLGCGVDRVYPSGNKHLFDAILNNGGAIVSEYPFGSPPKGDSLRRRNRIIVGLSRAMVVAECPDESGTLIAAKEAFEQVKPVFSFSFPDDRKSAEGSMRLVTNHEVRAVDPQLGFHQVPGAIGSFNTATVTMLFDLDGVLADTSRLSRNALIHAVKQIDGASPNKEAVKHVLRLSPRAALKRLSDSNIDTLLRSFDQYWRKHYTKDLTAHPQLRTILQKLTRLGMPMGVATSRNRSLATSALEALKLRGLFQEVTTWGDTARHKPDPHPVEHALENLPHGAAVIYIGDRPEDVLAAKSAKVLSVGATWFLNEDGKATLKESGPDYVVEQPSELFDLVLKLKRRSWASL